MLVSPLEQFEISSFFIFSFSYLDLSISNVSLFSSLVVFVILFFLSFGTHLPLFFSLFSQRCNEFFYSFVLNINLENIGRSGLYFVPFLFTLFVFLLSCNLLGLVPFSFTLSAQFVFTFSFSFLVWFSKLCIGFFKHGLKFFSILLPSGIPFILVPFFVFVETISFFVPVIALGVRLFANIISGHILLKVFVSFCWSILFVSNLTFSLHSLLIVVLYLLFFLEFAVALIQAYVFCMLASLSFGETLRGGH